jgi:anthranilate 1,2-dioxygenase large subunit/terephthalate 1,2-dioxygenase oxygenase component alpha subunit
MSTIEKPTAHWKSDSLTRVPFSLYTDPDVARREQERIFRGPTWNFLCLAVDLDEPGSYRTAYVGETPVIVARGADSEIYAFENRCAHRGALIALKNAGRVDSFQCVYHAWSYNLQGDLVGVAFENGVKGQGGMGPDFCKEEHGPRKLRTATFCGLVFGSFDDDVPPLEEYLGPEICSRIERILFRPVEVIGRFTQNIPNNWKLYMENVKDSYHASLLHVFFTTFKINRLSQKGGVITDASGAHHVSYSMIDDHSADDSYKAQGLRADTAGFGLKDPTLLEGFRDFDDGITLQILSVFPGFVLAQIQNTLNFRSVVPKGTGGTALEWVYLGYVDDTPEQRRMRLKQCNLIGPAGFISMEDGAVGGFVQRGIAGAASFESVVEMGGEETSSTEGRATEASVRGFWKAYRNFMGE